MADELPGDEADSADVGVAIFTTESESLRVGTKGSFNAQFAVGPPDELYGPYDENDATNPVKDYPMKRGLGITPKLGPVIGKSKLCGSCHTVLTPQIPLPTGAPDPAASAHGFNYPKAHVQTTYLEWLNSIFNDEVNKTDQSKSCMECHLPNYFRDDTENIEFQVANIEDGTFPDLPNRAPAEQITLDPRPYRRHTLVAINLFTMEMFDQFPKILGFSTLDPGAPISPSVFTPEPRLDLARDEALYLAKKKTVQLRINSVSVNRTGQTLDVTVEVVNLAGHKFPSGVGFRRSFIQFSVIGPDRETPIWVSGRTNESGVIIGHDGKPLKSEFSKDWNDLQPNFGLAGVDEPQLNITREDQVQVFETRHVNNSKPPQLTTSFLGLFEEVKDNRILPRSGYLFGILLPLGVDEL